MCVRVRLCVCGGVGGDVRVWCLSYLVGERLQICPAIPAVITDRCALYACASRVLSLLHNISSAAEDGRNATPTLQAHPVCGLEGRKGSLDVVLQGCSWDPSGEGTEGKEGFL